MSDDHKPRRQKRSGPASVAVTASVTIAPTTSDPAAGQAGPAIAFRVAFEGGRKAALDLSKHPRSALATQAASIIWGDVTAKAPKGSPGVVYHPQGALRRFGEHLAIADPAGRVTTFSDVTVGDVDSFEDYLRTRFPGNRTGYLNLSAFLKLLQAAEVLGLTRPDLKPRLAYLTKLDPFRDGPPCNAYSPGTMAGIRKAAKTEVKGSVRRHVLAKRRVERGCDPDPCGWMNADNLAWSAALRGLPGRFGAAELDRFHKVTGWTVASIHEQVFPGICDALAFSILIADETGMPIECIRELKADCLRHERDGHATLHYLKRRAKGAHNKTMDVTTRKRFSAGWLIKAFLAISAVARTHVSGEEGKWLFLGLCEHRLQRLRWEHMHVRGFAARNALTEDDGTPMTSVRPSRIRKTFKAARYRRVGGDLKLFADDHCRQVSATHYARIAANVELHEAAIAKGLQTALEGTFRTTVKTDGPADVGDDVAVAGCLDFHRSPFSEPGQPCGAPLLGCLDCPNAIVTEAKLPGLLHLLHDVVQKRQEMDLDSWRGSFGTAYARIMTILELFPKAVVSAATEEAAKSYGRSWSPIQLAYKV